MSQIKLLLIAAIGLWSICGLANAKVVSCYYGTWANYRPGDGKFEPSNVDPYLCTHLIYSFFGITSAGEFKTLDGWLDLEKDYGLGLIKRTMALKQINPKLKVIAAVGGWNEGSVKYSQMAATAQSRQVFITSALKFIKEYGFDGLDLDWEYPAQRGGSPQDKANLVTLLKEMREAFKPHNLEMSIAVGASENTARISYDIPSMAQHLDYINVMTYDFAMASDGKLGFNAPLKGQGQNNVESAIKYWLKAGAPATKLVLGLAFYGRSFQLSNPQQTTPGSPCSGPGAAGPFTRENGFMGYNEICGLLNTWTYKWADDNDVPYIYHSNQWIGYDNVQSINLKMDFLNSLNLAGAMVWSIETDDFRGNCGEKYPLLKAINNKLGKQPSAGNTTPQVGSTTPQVGNTTPNPTTAKTTLAPSKTPSPPVTGDCPTDGFFGVVADCTLFYRCVDGIRYNYHCNDGLHFDIATSVCNWPQDAVCRT